jgi:hypothetical protein
LARFLLGFSLPKDAVEVATAKIMKRYQVTVDASSVTVNATSEYFAAIAFSAESFCMRGDRLPGLTGSTILRVRAIGQRRICRVLWQDVVDQATREAELAFGQSIPAAERLAICPVEPEFSFEPSQRHDSDGAHYSALGDPNFGNAVGGRLTNLLEGSTIQA